MTKAILVTPSTWSAATDSYQDRPQTMVVHNEAQQQYVAHASDLEIEHPESCVFLSNLAFRPLCRTSTAHALWFEYVGIGHKATLLVFND